MSRNNINASVLLRKRRKASSHTRRKLFFEMLERRELLAAAIWHNVVSSFDVNGVQQATVDPLDVLRLVNEINAPLFSSPTGVLPRESSSPESGPYFDVDCDGRVSPVDVLSVVNFINVNGTGVVGGYSSDGGMYPIRTESS